MSNRTRRTIVIIIILSLVAVGYLTSCKPIITVTKVEKSKHVQIGDKMTYEVFTSDSTSFHTIKVYKVKDTIR